MSEGRVGNYFPVDMKEIQKLSREDVDTQAAVMTWLWVNECLAKGGRANTAPLSDDPFPEYDVVLGADNWNIVPNKPTTMAAIKREERGK